MELVIYGTLAALVLGTTSIIIASIVQRKNQTTPPSTEGSCFDGNFWQRLGWIILSRLLTVITLGLAYPAAVCMLLRWECKHTVINGRRLKFTGRGAQLFGKYILWWLLSVITFGIYGIWLGLNMKKWTVEHTVYADDHTQAVSRFTGGVGGFLGIHLLAGFLTVFTVGIGAPWAKRMVIQWEMRHTYISGTRLGFTGKGGQLLGKYLLWGLLTVITLGIYGLFVPIRFLKWQYKHTGATPVESVPREKKASVGAILAVVGVGLLVIALVIGAILFTQPTRAVVKDTEVLSLHTVISGPSALIPSPADAENLPGNFEDSESYFTFDGNDFSFALDPALLPEELQQSDWAQTYFTANGTIGSTAYLDTEKDILYLDYSVENANCPTYLSIDSKQSGTGYAEPLCKIVSRGEGIHSVHYPYDRIPEYIYVMTFVHVGEGRYYFLPLHKQPLTVIAGTTDDLEAVRGEEDVPAGADSISLAGTWVAVGMPEASSGPADDIHSYFADCGYYVFSDDGTFEYEQLMMAKSDGWYHMGGGETSYSGDYQYDGTTLTLHFTTYYERYYDEELGYEMTRPVAYDCTEQFQFRLAEDGLTTDHSEHPRLGQLLTFEQRNTNDPILDMLSILTQNY